MNFKSICVESVTNRKAMIVDGFIKVSQLILHVKNDVFIIV